jgi:methionyl-tRNA synthetase
MQKKKIEWRWDCGCYVPFCPYCDEMASYEDRCAFCGKEYEWVEPQHNPTIVQVEEYTVTQATNNHISITKDNKMIYHASCTKKMTEEELKKEVDIYLKLIEIPLKDESQD